MKAKLPTSQEELIAAASKGALSAIPVVGGLVAELGNCLINPLEKRKRAWVEEIELILSELSAKYERLPANLAEDPVFVSALLSATKIAIATHQKHKVTALRAFLIAIGSQRITDEDLQQVLMRLIEDLSPGHMEVLRYLEYDYAYISQLDTLEAVYCRYANDYDGHLDRMSFRWMLADLTSRMVIHLGDLEDMDEFSSLRVTIIDGDSKVRPLQITALGYQLLELIRQET